MKLCRVCKQPNLTKKSTCSYECAKKDLENKQRIKREKAFNKKLAADDLKKLKNKAWDTFSLYIRTKYSDKDGNCTCVTCGNIKPIKQMQAGHAVRGRGGYILFDERAVRPQCWWCNCKMAGRYDDFMYYLVNVEKSMTPDEYNQIKIESKKEVVKRSKSDYEEIIAHYRALIDIEQNKRRKL